MKPLLALILLASVAFSTITFDYPVSVRATDGSVASLTAGDMGITPGQETSITADRLSEKLVTCPGRMVCYDNETINATVPWDWNRMRVLDTPEGWTTDASTLKTMDIRVLVPRNAVEKEYELTVRAESCLNPDVEQCAPRTLPDTVKLRLRVSRDVYDYSPANLRVDAGALSRIPIMITSRSLGADEISLLPVSGAPMKWLGGDQVAIAPLATSVARVSISPFEEGQYNLVFESTLNRSGTVKEISVPVRVVPTVSSKLKSFKEGFALVPNMLQPFYSLLSFFG